MTAVELEFYNKETGNWDSGGLELANGYIIKNDQDGFEEQVFSTIETATEFALSLPGWRVWRIVPVNAVDIPKSVLRMVYNYKVWNST